MNNDPFDVLSRYVGPGADRSWIWNPTHPLSIAVTTGAMLVLLLAGILSQ
jgi:hypothetical protein